MTDFEKGSQDVLAFVEQRLREIEALLRTDACVTDHIPGDARSRKLAEGLVDSMAHYLSAVAASPRWDSEVFSGLAGSVESVLREHGLKPPAEGDEEAPELSEPVSEPAPAQSVSGPPPGYGPPGYAAVTTPGARVSWLADGYVRAGKGTVEGRKNNFADVSVRGDDNIKYVFNWVLLRPLQAGPITVSMTPLEVAAVLRALGRSNDRGDDPEFFGPREWVVKRLLVARGE